MPGGRRPSTARRRSPPAGSVEGRPPRSNPVIVWALSGPGDPPPSPGGVSRSPVAGPLLSAAVHSAPARGSPTREFDVDPALTSRDLRADSPGEPSCDVGLDALSGGALAPGGRTPHPFRFARKDAAAAHVRGKCSGRARGSARGGGRVVAGRGGRGRPVHRHPRGARERRPRGRPRGRRRRPPRTVGDVVVGRYRIVALDRTALLLERLEDGERLTLRPTGE